MFKKTTLIILIILVPVITIGVIRKLISENQIFVSNSHEVNQLENKNMSKRIIRQPAVAGGFYPAEAKGLVDIVQNFLDQAEILPTTSTPKILIVPHAGYDYSGQVAASGFKQLIGQNIKRVIILGPSHHFPVSGLILSSATEWQTPLGSAKVSSLNQLLVRNSLFQISDQIHKPEHSIEIELPFLQKIFPDIEIVPIIVGQLNAKQQAVFASTLSSYLDAETVVVVSVDLAHYHPYQENVFLDQESINHILNLDSAGILNDEIDAPWAVATILKLAKDQGLQPKLIQYLNSGDVTSDKTSVVGYSAVGFYGNSMTKGNADNYSDAEKKELLTIARKALETYIREGKTFKLSGGSRKLQEERGVFVTLTKNGQLRGCIGYIDPIKPLIEAVRDNAISAAVHDDRFSPVKASELEDIKIEISILTVPQPDTLENIVSSKLGVVLRQGNYGATYLPQVWDGLPDAKQFFSTLCQKAGLDSDCWQDSSTEYLSYRAIVFDE
ncbi:MAG: AmmeMemoRadiSam system protein B [Patescibacteria group bacterium]|nr:AmmeMemoRadiSam system protein B [Patescibacteria group bacterium]